MIENTQTTIFENLKQRLTNPFLFTYFWVFSTYNYQLFLYLWMEPLKMSDKLKYVHPKWDVLPPIALALIFIIVLPYIDIIVEYVKEIAERFKRILFNNLKIINYHTEDEVNEIQKRYRALRKDYEEIYAKYDKSNHNGGYQLNDQESINEQVEGEFSEANSNPFAHKDDPKSEAKPKPRATDTFKEFLAKNKIRISIPRNLLHLLRLAAKSKNGQIVSINDNNSILISDGINRWIDTPDNIHLLLEALVTDRYFSVAKRIDDDTESYSITTKGYDLYDQIVKEAELNIK